MRRLADASRHGPPGHRSEFLTVRCRKTTLPSRVARQMGAPGAVSSPWPPIFCTNGTNVETNGNTGYGRTAKTALSAIVVCPTLTSCVSRPARPGDRALPHRPSDAYVRIAFLRAREYRETDLCHRRGRTGTRRGNHDHLLVRRSDRLHDGIRRRPRGHGFAVYSPPESLSMTRRSRLVGRPCSPAAGSR